MNSEENQPLEENDASVENAQQENDSSVENAQQENAEQEKPKRKRGGGGKRNNRTPRLKDWVQVIRSGGNSLPNTEIKLLVNKATGLVELITNAPKNEGSAEMEGARTQIFRITDLEIIDDPNRNPLEQQEKAEPEAAQPVEVPQE